MNNTRIIETAINENGHSYIFSDKQQKGWNLPGYIITDLFFSDQYPPCMLATNDKITNSDFNLNPGEIRFFRSDILPTLPVYTGLHNKKNSGNIKDFFYHSTTTIDYVMVYQGEIVLIVGDKEVVLKSGDVVVQRGASHAWHNYSNEVATIMGVMIGVIPPKQFMRVDITPPDNAASSSSPSKN